METDKRYFYTDMKGIRSPPCIIDKKKHLKYFELEELVHVLNKLNEENNDLKRQNDLLFTENNKLRVTMIHYQDLREDIKWLRENTVWEQMPTSSRTSSKITTNGDE